MSILAAISPHAGAIKIGLAVLGIVGIAAGSAWATHRIDQVALLKLEAKWKDAEIAAVEAARKIQKAQDEVSLKAAVAEAKAQQQIVTKTETVVREVPKYVPVASKCAVTVGFLRVLDAAILGRSPADLPLPAGKSNDSCADLDAPTVAARLVANLGTCQANAQQLNGLQDWVRKIGEASKLK